MENKMVEILSKLNTSSQEVTPDILVLQFTIVNACIVGEPGNKGSGWVLVDTGLENSAGFIRKSAANRFGQNSKPKAIVLTHTF